MHFDPYESKKNRRRRLLSDALILLVVVLFIWGIYSVFIGVRKQVNIYDFSALSASEDVDGGNRSFVAFLNEARRFGDEQTLSDSLIHTYRIPTALLNMEEPYSQDKPYFFYDDKQLVLAQTVLSETADERVLEVFSAKADVRFSNGKGTVKLSDFAIDTVTYHARTGKLTYRPYNAKTFHVNLFGITVSVEGSNVVCTEYNAAVAGANLQEVKVSRLIYDPIRSTYGNTDVSVTDSAASLSVNPAGKKKKECFNIATSDGLFAQYKTIEFSFAYEGDTPPTLLFLANKG